jgi:hypothetical protein
MHTLGLPPPPGTAAGSQSPAAYEFTPGHTLKDRPIGSSRTAPANRHRQSTEITVRPRLNERSATTFDQRRTSSRVAQNEIRTNRIRLSGETLMAGRESGKDNRGSANLNAAILEPSAGWQLALTFEEIP